MTPFDRQAPIKRTIEFLYLFKLLSAQPFPERHRPQCQDTELYSPVWCVPVAIEPLLGFLYRSIFVPTSIYYWLFTCESQYWASLSPSLAEYVNRQQSVTTDIIAKNITPTTNKFNMFFPHQFYSQHGLYSSKEKLNSYGNLVLQSITVISSRLKTILCDRLRKMVYPELVNILLRVNNSLQAIPLFHLKLSHIKAKKIQPRIQIKG